MLVSTLFPEISSFQHWLGGLGPFGLSLRDHMVGRHVTSRDGFGRHPTSLAD